MRLFVVALTAACASAVGAACVSTPQFETLSGDGTSSGATDGTPIGMPPVVSALADAQDVAPSTDGAMVPDGATALDGAVDVAPGVDGSPPPPPPPVTCPPAGAPAGTACCGAGGTAPPCIGLACSHCGDCIALGCPVGLICCADSPGGSGKYKAMGCRTAALAGTCP